MRTSIVLALGICAATGVAVAQEAPQWEVSGGYQYTRTGIPSFLSASGFNFGVQENLKQLVRRDV